MQVIRLVVLSSLFLFLGGCGTTSNLKPVSGSAEVKAKSSFTGYNKVIVVDFKENTASEPFKGGQTFANYITSELSKKKTFPVVSRKRDQSHAILIDGKVTNYDKGNAVARMLIGFTAGSSNFDAVVNVSDNQTGEKLGSIHVDKNSWALGGTLAAAQTVETLMQSAAEKVASELSKDKIEKVASKQITDNLNQNIR